MKGIAKEETICQTMAFAMRRSRFCMAVLGPASGAVLLLLGALSYWGVGCRPAPPPPASKAEVKPHWDTLLSFHFAGSRQILAETNAATLRALLELPQTSALGTNVGIKLASALATVLAPAEQIETAKELSWSLVREVAGRECWLALRRPRGGDPEWTFAVFLDPDSLALAQTNMASLLQSLGSSPLGGGSTTLAASRLYTLLDFLAAGTNSWSGFLTSRTNGSEVVYSNLAVRVAHVGNWLLGGVGPQGLPGLDNAMASTTSSGRPVPSAVDYWLRLEVDNEKLENANLSILDSPLSKFSFSLTSLKERITTAALLEFGKEPKLRMEPWTIPTNAIHDPLVSFTASHGFDSWAHRLLPSTNVALPAVSSQLFVWARDEVPFMSLAATPVQDATNVLLSLGPSLVPSANARLDGLGAGGLLWNPERLSVVWRGLPAFVPYLEPFVEGAGQYLIGGFFPLTTQPTNPAPAELLGQVSGRTNLVYYDWEITELRLGQWAQMFQYASFLSTKPQLSPNMPAKLWLAAIAPLLGNTVTEIIRESSTSFRLSRRSHVGLTGVELNFLAQWFDEPSFPFAGFRMPYEPLGFPTKAKGLRQNKQNSGPDAKAGEVPGPASSAPIPPPP